MDGGNSRVIDRWAARGVVGLPSARTTLNTASTHHPYDLVDMITASHFLPWFLPLH